MKQVSLFDDDGSPRKPEPPRFDGADYVHERDAPRLAGQLQRVFELMRDGRWRTLKMIAAATGDPEPSISAQLRHLRKARFGAHHVDRRYLHDGLYEYKLTVNEQCEAIS